MSKIKKPSERLSEWFKAAISHQLKKQEKLIKKLDFKPLYKHYEEINKRTPAKSIMEKVEEFNKQNE